MNILNKVFLWIGYRVLIFWYGFIGFFPKTFDTSKPKSLFFLTLMSSIYIGFFTSVPKWFPLSLLLIALFIYDWESGRVTHFWRKRMNIPGSREIKQIKRFKKF